MRYTRDSRHRRHHPEGPEFPQHDAHDHGAHHEAHAPHEHGPRRGRREFGVPAFDGPGFEGSTGFRGRGGWDGRRGRGRAGRGDVRAAVLILLAEAPMHGYQLMQAMAERTNGVWRPSPGAIYPTISQLEDEGLVTTVADGGRKLVTLTDAGRAYLAENPVADPFEALAGPPGQGHDLRSALEEIAIATRLIGKNATEPQVRAAHQVLSETRRSLYL